MSMNGTEIVAQSMSTKMQLAKLVISVVAGFTATKLTERSFDFAVLKFRAHKTQTTV